MACLARKPRALFLNLTASSAPSTPTLHGTLIRWWADGRAWVDGHWLDILIALVAGVLIYGLLALLRRWAMRHARRQAGNLTLTDIFGRVIAKTRSPILILVALRLVAGSANPPALMLQAIHLVFTIAIVLQVAIWGREVLLGLIQRRAASGDQETLVNAMGIIRLLISVALFAIAAIVILDNIGVNVTGLVAGLGIGGIAIGLAAQGIFSDLFAALSIIFDRPFRNGETIKWDNSIATVERIGLKSTRLRSVNGELLIVSNTNLLGKEISNFAHLHRRRVTFTFNIVYQTSPAMLRALPALLEQQVRDAGHEFIRSSLLQFAASSLDFELLFDVHSEDYDVVAAARTDVGVRVVEALGKAGYEFAYPTQTTFTADPDGRMILPFADPRPAASASTKPRTIG